MIPASSEMGSGSIFIFLHTGSYFVLISLDSRFWAQGLVVLFVFDEGLKKVFAIFILHTLHQDSYSPSLHLPIA